MFGFIKYLQDFFDKLHRNKRLWYTTIFFISVFGISFSIFLLSSMTNKISEEIYANQVLKHKLNYESFSSLTQDDLKRISLVLLNNEDLLNLIKAKNIDALNSKLKILNKNFLDNKFENMIIEYIDIENPNKKNTVISTIKAKNSIFGLEMYTEGVFYTYLTPVIINDSVVGVYEIRTSLDNVLNNFQNLDQEFVFLLNKSMASHMALDQREANYDNFNDSLIFDKRSPHTMFIKELGGLSFEEYRFFLDEGYAITKNHYAAHVDIEDVNGIGLGVIVLFENKDKQHGLIHMFNKMKSQVVIIALGLIVSILLFMF